LTECFLARTAKTYILFVIAAYNTETVKIFKQPTPPSYSFGSRTRYSKRDGSPAPNAYTVPPLIGSKTPIKRSAPAYVMSGRARIGGFSEDLSKVNELDTLFV